jgi:hypothetical protein
MAAGMNDNEYVSYPMFKGLQKPLEFMGIQGSLHHMGSMCCWWSHSWLHHRAYCIFGFVAGLITLAVSPLYWCGSYLLQTEERTAHQEGRPWCVHLCLFKKNVIKLIE